MVAHDPIWYGNTSYEIERRTDSDHSMLSTSSTVLYTMVVNETSMRGVNNRSGLAHSNAYVEFSIAVSVAVNESAVAISVGASVAITESVVGSSIAARMQVKPWLISEPACSLLVLDCYDSNLSGTENEVLAQWSSFDPATTAGVVIRHCLNLEVPDMLTKFSRLKSLKFYHSTITSWNESAAVSQANHSNTIMLFLVRVTLPDGLLPAGAHSSDFPQGLADIEICHTNLRTLPEDLDSKWPQLSSIYIEACDLTEVPPSLARLAPYDLSLAMNPITSIPSTLLEGDLVFLHIGATRISELPEKVNDVSPLKQIRVDNTNVEFFWSWINPLIESAGSVLSDVPTAVVASNTPSARIYNAFLKESKQSFQHLTTKINRVFCPIHQ